jgi:putative phosphoesterase
MKIAILSDSHDHLPNTKLAVERVQKLGAEVLLFCGDFCAPRAAMEVGKFNGPVYMIFGNNDGDQLNIYLRVIENCSDVKFMLEGNGILELDGRKIAMTHYPRYADALARTGDYDLVVFGHDHKARIETHGKCLAVNPGCLNAVRSDDNIGFAIYDTMTHQAELHGLDG